MHLWQIIKEENPIWFFDATGSIVKSIKEQKKTMLYSIAVHDVKNAKIFSIFDFLTSSHSSKSIQTYLTCFKDYIDDFKLGYPKFVVVDFSWALINSINKTFNKCSILPYLQDCFDLIFNQTNTFLSTIQIRIHLCAFHLIKIIKKRVTNIQPRLSKQVKNDFLFSFAMLQTSTGINEFNKTLFNVFRVFKTKFLDDNCISSAKILHKEINETKFTFNNCENLNTTKNDLNFDKIIQDEQLETVREKSPFKIYFNEKLKDIKKEIDDINNFQTAEYEKFELIRKQKMESMKSINGVNKKEKKMSLNLEETNYMKLNPKYNEELIKIIEDYLYIFPIWTSIL